MHRTANHRSALGVLSSLTVLLALSGVGAAAFASGCSVEVTGNPGVPDAGTGSETGSVDSGGSTDSDAGCVAKGTGTVNLVVTGLPAGVAAKVKLTGPGGTATDETASATISSAAAGTYTATAERVKQSDAIVGTLFDPTISTASFCVADAQTQTVTVTYAAIPTSNKLWTTSENNTDGSETLGFSSASLGATGAPAAGIKTTSPASKSVAFDKDGNLWSIGLTVADAPLERYSAASLATNGTKTADRAITIDVGCVPGLEQLAFDPSGALWATAPCANKIIRFTPAQIAASGTVTPAADDIATGTTAPLGIAFDATGNMWASDDTSLWFYDAGHLVAGQAHTPSLQIHVKQVNTDILVPGALAFDANGNLWGASGSNLIFKMTAADLAAGGVTTKDVTPAVQLTIDPLALVETIAFDEGGGLWLTFLAGKIARLDPTALGASANPAVPATIISSADIGSAGGLAFFPAASGLPLYSKF